MSEVKFTSYIISLESAQERRAHSEREIRKSGLPFEFVSAVDLRSSSLSNTPEYNERKSISFVGRPLTNGEVGCFLSHKKCLERFIASDNQFCFIFEDDFSIRPDYIEKIKEFPEEISKSGLSIEAINLSKTSNQFTGKSYPSLLGNLQEAYYFPIIASGFFWTRAGAQAFLDETSEVFAPVDVYFRSFFTKRGTGFCFEKKIVKQAKFSSEIDFVKSNHIAIRKKPPKNLFFFLRNARRRYTCYAYAIGNKFFW